MKSLIVAVFVGAAGLLATHANAMTVPSIAAGPSTAIKTGWHSHCWFSHGHRDCRRWR